MPNYISRKLFEKKAVDRWENEGGSLSAEQTNAPEESSSGDRISEKTSPQILREGNQNTIR
jgi:hypothetical protein